MVAAGEAHEGIAHAAHAIYAGTMDTLTHELEARPGYSLVVTGHSLGAATALLFTILLHHHRRKQLADPRLPASAVPYYGVDVKCIACECAGCCRRSCAPLLPLGFRQRPVTCVTAAC